MNIDLSHAARRSLAVIGTAALAACASSTTPPQREPDQWLRAFSTVRFDSARALAVIPRRASPDSVRERIADVLEVGGRVASYRGDTLVMEPLYLTTYRPRRTTRAMTYGGRPGLLPDLVLVPVGQGTSIREFHTPGPKRPWLTVANVIHAGFLLALLSTDLALIFGHRSR